jgi:hypothetical protein
MVAFAALRHRGTFSAPEWNECLKDGLYETTRSGPTVIRECFPTATISHLRSSGRANDVRVLLGALPGGTMEVGAVDAYLMNGVRGTKKPGQSLFDRADALVAALSSLPHVRSDFVEVESWPSGTVRWQAGCPNAHLVEGVVALVQ